MILNAVALKLVHVPNSSLLFTSRKFAGNQTSFNAFNIIQQGGQTRLTWIRCWMEMLNLLYRGLRVTLLPAGGSRTCPCIHFHNSDTALRAVSSTDPTQSKICTKSSSPYEIFIPCAKSSAPYFGSSPGLTEAEPSSNQNELQPCDADTSS